MRRFVGNLPRAALVALAALTVITARGTAQDAKAEVLAVGQSLFDAMAKRDTAAIRRLMFPAGILVAALETDGKPTPRHSTVDQFVAQVAQSPTPLIERMWNAQINVSGPIATIWTQYDFHRGLEWSHCGIDTFQLVKTPAGWQISGLIYTIVRDHCPKNPAGPPRLP